jgi:MFS transporter, DHA2 family, methylenomycin A resistance protein
MMTSPPRNSELTTTGLIAVSVGNFLVCFDASSVNVALPSITRSLSASPSLQPWYLDSYTIPLCVFLLAAGVAGDKFGVGRVYRAALVAFAATSFLCAIAQTGPELIAGGAAEGVSARFMLPMTLSIITKGVGDPAQRSRAIAAWGVVGGLGIAFAPVVGGLITNFIGWRWLFSVNVPICLAAVAMVWRFRDQSADPSRRFTPFAQLLFCAALTCLAGALIDGARSTFASFTVALLGVGFVLSLSALIVTQRRTHNPLVPRGLLSHRPYTLVAVSGGLYQLGAYGTLLVLALYLEQSQGYRADVAGYVMLPYCVAWLVGNSLAVKVGPAIRRRIILGAAGLGASGAIAVAVLSLARSVPVTMTLTVPIGVAAGLLAPLLSSEAMQLCPPEVSGTGSGVLNTSRQIGMVIAIAILADMSFELQLLVPMIVITVSLLAVLGCCFVAFKVDSKEREGRMATHSHDDDSLRLSARDG